MNVYLLETARQLARRGIKVDVFTRRHDPADPEIVELDQGASVIHVEAGPLDAEKSGVHSLLPSFGRSVLDWVGSREDRYNLVWTHYWLSGLVGIDLSKRWDIPHVTSFHTLAELKRKARKAERDVPERDPAERRIMREADRIVVWTEEEFNSLQSMYGVPSQLMTVIPPGVDSGRFLPIDQATARAELGLPDGDIVMYVGRLEPLKGVDILLKAFSSIGRQDDRHLIIVGGSKDSPERVRLVNLASHLGISTRVKFVPSVDQSSLRSYYSAADISVLPSHYESFGLAALEASACGTPVVASRVGGLPTVIKDYETGLLVEQGQSDDLSRKLEILLRDEGLRTRMGATARQHAEKLSWAAAVDQLLTLFTALTADPVSAGCAPAAG